MTDTTALAELDYRPLTDDRDIERLVNVLLERPSAARTWIMLLDDQLRSTRVIIPIDDLPNDPQAPAAMPSGGAAVRIAFWVPMMRPRMCSGMRSIMSTPIRLPNRPLDRPTTNAPAKTPQSEGRAAITPNPIVLPTTPVTNQMRLRPRAPATA